MKRLFTGLAVTLVAAVWMTGSWFFFNSIAAGAQGSDTPAAIEAGKDNPHDVGSPAGKCEHHKHHHFGFRFLEKLNLTDRQKDQVHSIINEERPKIKPLVQNLKAGRDQLSTLRKSGPFDEAKVRAVAKGQADILTELIVEKERVKSKIYAVLTPEQRARAEQLREEWKAQRKECKHHKD
jgi:protein CpxP